MRPYGLSVFWKAFSEAHPGFEHPLQCGIAGFYLGLWEQQQGNLSGAAALFQQGAQARHWEGEGEDLVSRQTPKGLNGRYVFDGILSTERQRQPVLLRLCIF